MPNAVEIDRYDRSGTNRIAEREQMLDLFRFAPLYQLGETIHAVLEQSRAAGSGRGRGRRSSFPATLQFGLLVAARAYTSVPRVVRALADDGTWRQIRERYLSATGEQLPLRPPNRDQLDHFKERISTRTVLVELQDMFRRCAIAQARDHGNLRPGHARDHTRPSDANSIYGDGTTVAPYSKVLTVTDPFDPTRLRILGSRAKDPSRAKVQRTHSDMTEDGKNIRGVNMVSAHTWTPWGRVVLGTATALRAEQWAALDVIDAVAARAGEGLHTVIWDRAITGWSVDYLMASYGVQVLGKSVGKSATPDEDHVDQTDDDATAATASTGYVLMSPKKREQAERALAKKQSRNQTRLKTAEPDGTSRFTLSETYLAQRAERLAVELDVPVTPLVIRTLRQDQLAHMYIGKRPTPVGTNIYETTNGFEPVYGKTYYLDPVTHDTPHGTCEHELVVDDGSLYLVGYDPIEEHPVKAAHLPCKSSTASKEADCRWSRRSEYTVPCQNGSFTYVHVWAPKADCGAPDQPKPIRADPAGSELRPLSRADNAFKEAFSRRNDAESYNAWYKRTLPIPGRAASLTLEGQELDFLTAAILNNSITMSRRDLD